MKRMLKSELGGGTEEGGRAIYAAWLGSLRLDTWARRMVVVVLMLD